MLLTLVSFPKCMLKRVSALTNQEPAVKVHSVTCCGSFPTRFIINKSIPNAVVDLDDPNEYEIPAALQRKVAATILETCRDSIGDSLTGACKGDFKVQHV